MGKNKAAVDLVKLRWKGKTKAERKEHGRMMALRRWEKARKKAEKTS